MKSKLSVDEWKEKWHKAAGKPKGLLMVGLIGIGLIFASTLFPKTAKKSTVATESFSVEDYKAELERSVERLVETITGDKNCTVVITLDGGARYLYADSVTTSSADHSTDSGATQTDNSTARSYVTVRNDTGGEEALPVTYYLPQVRGVAIVCNGGNDTGIAEQVANAVTAALHITSSRVYITGGKGS